MSGLLAGRKAVVRSGGSGIGQAIFLACDLSAYVTVSIIMADGGYRTI